MIKLERKDKDINNNKYSEPPRPKVGASVSILIKHLQLILRETVMLYIIPYHIISYLLSHCSIEIPLFPKMTSPQPLSHFGKFLKNLTARNALQNSNHSRNRISGRKRNQYVHMVLSYLTPVYLKIKMTCNLQKQLFYPRANFLSEDLFSILGAPNQMIFSFINRMACSSEAHAVILWGYHIFLKLYGDNANYKEES